MWSGKNRYKQITHSYVYYLFSAQMEVVAENSNQNINMYNHDHDNKNDHNHEDTYWEHFLETNDTDKTEPESYSVTPCLMSPKDEPIMVSKQLQLYSRWNYYYHLPNDKNWNLASYKTIMSDIDTLEKLIAVNETVTDNVIKNCMLFVMRKGVTPMWEDSCNRNGGCFSYKVSNKVVVNVWRELTYVLCGNSLMYDVNHMDMVNGITISPKRGFCIVKIWLKNCSLQDPNVIADVDNLVKAGCLFKTHKAEF